MTRLNTTELMILLLRKSVKVLHDYVYQNNDGFIAKDVIREIISIKKSFSYMHIKDSNFYYFLKFVCKNFDRFDINKCQVQFTKNLPYSTYSLDCVKSLNYSWPGYGSGSLLHYSDVKVLDEIADYHNIYSKAFILTDKKTDFKFVVTTSVTYSKGIAVFFENGISNYLYKVLNEIYEIKSREGTLHEITEEEIKRKEILNYYKE